MEWLVKGSTQAVPLVLTVARVTALSGNVVGPPSNVLVLDNPVPLEATAARGNVVSVNAKGPPRTVPLLTNLVHGVKNVAQGIVVSGNVKEDQGSDFRFSQRVPVVPAGSVE